MVVGWSDSKICNDIKPFVKDMPLSIQKYMCEIIISNSMYITGDIANAIPECNRDVTLDLIRDFSRLNNAFNTYYSEGFNILKSTFPDVFKNQNPLLSAVSSTKACVGYYENILEKLRALSLTDDEINRMQEWTTFLFKDEQDLLEFMWYFTRPTAASIDSISENRFEVDDYFLGIWKLVQCNFPINKMDDYIARAMSCYCSGLDLWTGDSIPEDPEFDDIKKYLVGGPDFEVRRQCPVIRIYT